MAAQTPVQSYDKESGVVYTDVVIPLKRTLRNTYGSSWVHESPFLSTRWKKPNPIGANSLKTMAMRCVLSDQRVLAPSHFEAVPWRIAEYLWNSLRQSLKTSLHMWKLLSTAYPEDFKQLEPHYSFKPASKGLPTADYLKLLTSDSSKWLTVLDLSTSFIDSLPDLVGVVGITNLAAFKITSEPMMADNSDALAVTLTDRVIRTWSEHAIANKAFKHLAILAVSQQPELTERVFTYLGDFEALGFFLVQGCPRFAQKRTRDLAEAHGWEVCVKQCPNDSFYACVKRLLDIMPGGNQESVTEIASRPILEFSPLTPKRGKTSENYTIIFKRKRGSSAPRGRDGREREAVINRGATKVTKRERKPVLKTNKKKDMRALLGQFLRSVLPPP